ncbi:peptidoglycan-binding domain-containing protein [Azospirillum sp.]|uniref:peptidoglycan-binding domain-containing protein n=1 Tax=Azospirillum sp. TaxID=34012 RepID=UPI003D748AA6
MTRILFASTLLLTAAMPAFAASKCDPRGMPPDAYTGYVTDAQEQLNERGFNAGTADGKPGSRTQAAIRAYQKKAGLPVDGCVSKELVDHLHFAQPKVYGGSKR